MECGTILETNNDAATLFCGVERGVLEGVYNKHARQE
jgi:hypothetical protein